MQNGGLRTKGITKIGTPEHPLITVVTVVYNGAATLEQTILSVVNQTYDNVEYIIIDGASTDCTLDIVKKYEDKIDYWQCEPDGGIYDAMNKGIGLATGEWINFMNSGDSFASFTVLGSVFSACVKHSDVIYGNWCFNDKVYRPKALFKLPIRLPFCHQAVFVRKNSLTKTLFDVSYKLIADEVFFYTMYKKNKTILSYTNLTLPTNSLV